MPKQPTTCAAQRKRSCGLGHLEYHLYLPEHWVMATMPSESPGLWGTDVKTRRTGKLLTHGRPRDDRKLTLSYCEPTGTSRTLEDDGPTRDDKPTRRLRTHSNWEDTARSAPHINRVESWLCTRLPYYSRCSTVFVEGGSQLELGS